MRDEPTQRRRATLDVLLDSALVAIVRDADEHRARALAEALIDAGIRALEVTTATPGCFALLEHLAPRAAAKRVALGIGTVRSVEHVARAHQAGASFVVSPHTDERLIAAAHAADLVAIAGALTPTEVLRAADAGAEVVKLFPISAVGGARYVRQLRGPLPDVRLWASGDVALDDVEELLEAGVSLLGLTSALTGELGPDLHAEVAGRVGRATESVANVRHGRWLLLVQGQLQLMRLGLRELRGLPAEDHVRVEDLLPGRRGQAVRLARLLAEAGVPRDAKVELSSADGSFRRVVSAAALADGGLLHYATDGHPLGRADGGPLRLYVVGGAAGCDNVKHLAQIALTRG